jgi:hypothetical protein
VILEPVTALITVKIGNLVESDPAQRERDKFGQGDRVTAVNKATELMIESD